MDEAFKAAADTYLAVGGQSATYHSMLAGDIQLTVVIERAVEVVDEGAGAYVRKPMATIKSGLVTPKRGDVIEAATERWSVEQVGTDDGYLLQLWIQKKP